MRKARETDGTRRFERSEWLAKAQVQGFSQDWHQAKDETHHRRLMKMTKASWKMN